METLELKIRQVPPLKQVGIKSATPNRLALHDLKKMREAHFSSRNQTPKSERNPVLETLNQINSIQEELKHKKLPEKGKSPELKLVFCKNSRPKSAFKGSEDNQELIKIAESTANLFKSRRGTSGRIEIEACSKLSFADNEENTGGCVTQRATNRKMMNKLPKPVANSTNLLRKYLRK